MEAVLRRSRAARGFGLNSFPRRKECRCGLQSHESARTRGFPQPAYNLLRIEGERIAVELRVPGGERWSLGDYPRDWPAELTAREIDPFVRPSRGVSLADDEPTAS